MTCILDIVICMYYILILYCCSNLSHTYTPLSPIIVVTGKSRSTKRSCVSRSRKNDARKKRKSNWRTTRSGASSMSSWPRSAARAKDLERDKIGHPWKMTCKKTAGSDMPVKAASAVRSTYPAMTRMP